MVVLLVLLALMVVLLVLLALMGVLKYFSKKKSLINK